MSKKQKTVISGIGILVLAGISLSLLVITLPGAVKRYEIEPEITVPAYKSDITRVIEAYERLMENYINLTESNMTAGRKEMTAMNQKLDAMDRKLSELSKQLDAIQKKLGIEVPQKPQVKPDTPVPTQTENPG